MQGLNKSFDVSIVGRRPDSAVAMNKALMLDGFGKPFGELRTVVGLDDLEFKGSDFLSSFDKLSAQQTVGLFGWPSVGPSRINVQQGIGGQAIVRLAVQHRINLD